MHAVITENRAQIAEPCRVHHVRRLSVFGSVVREDFDPDLSDVDFLVDFDSMSEMVQGRVEQQRNIVAFRNRIMHGCFSIHDALPWSASRTELPGLIADVKSLHGGMDT